MPVPTAGGQDIATLLRTIIGDTDSNNYEFSDADITNLLSRAVTFYTRYRPYYIESTITTTQDVQDYLAPASAIKMVSVEWRPYPGISANTFVGFWNALYGSADILPSKDWRDDVLNKIRQELAVRYDNLGAGASDLIQYPTSYANTNYIRLYPIPTTSGTEIDIRYTATHPLQSNDYFTIPSHHAIWLQKLVEAEVYDIRANKMSSTATDFGVGTSRIRFDSAIKNLRMMANSLRQEVIDALSIPIGTHG